MFFFQVVMIQACQPWKKAQEHIGQSTSQIPTLTLEPPDPVEKSVGMNETERHADVPDDIERSSSSNHIDARKPPTGADKQYIVLKDPNCALLMATVQGGYAHRGEFTAAFSKQLAQSNGDTNILEMFSGASDTLANSADSKIQIQLPECRTTLRKTLKL